MAAEGVTSAAMKEAVLAAVKEELAAHKEEVDELRRTLTAVQGELVAVKGKLEAVECELAVVKVELAEHKGAMAEKLAEGSKASNAEGLRGKSRKRRQETTTEFAREEERGREMQELNQPRAMEEPAGCEVGQMMQDLKLDVELQIKESVDRKVEWQEIKEASQSLILNLMELSGLSDAMLAHVVSALDFLTRGKSIPVVAPHVASCSTQVIPPTNASPDTVAEEKADDGMPKATTPTSTSSPTSGRESIRPVVSVATTTDLRANPVLPDRASLKAKYKQRMLNFARPAGPTLPAPSETVPPTTRQSADDDSEEEDKGKTKGRRPLSVEELQLKCKEQWLRYFPWLFISETKDGRPCMRCSVCMVFGDPHYKYGRYGEGGLDIQKQTMRKHHFSVKHEAAVLQKEQRDGLKKGQKSMTTFDKGDDDARRIARLMAIALFICKSDAPIVLFVALVQFMAEQGTPDMPVKENGTYYSEEALAAKDAATAFPDLQIVDKAVRSVVDILGRLVVHTRFKELQEVICETHLEMQGIKDVRWLSRGNAIQRLVAVFPAVVIVLQEFDKKMYATVTSFKFHFLLYLLADVLKELNLLNLKFQQRQTVHNTTLLLRTRYLDSNDETFGQSGAALGPFLAKHASGKCREVKVDGLDSTGVPTTHRYLLHEEAIVGQQSKGDLNSCLKLGRDFVVELIKQLDYRLHDLASLNGAKLFKKSQYPKSQAKRERRLAQWLQSLRDMYKKHPEDPDTLPGVLGVLS
ncbi:unnamed protein product [Closterium sp. Naga37s-1]|nr:unnamed protein product [Closterium sp. Naga37s-1]